MHFEYNYAFCVEYYAFGLPSSEESEENPPSRMNMPLIHIWYRNYWMWISKITLPVFSVRAGSNCWLQYQLIFWKSVTFYSINIASLSQGCITKVPAQHYIKDQHCTEQHQEPIINKYIWYIFDLIYIYVYTVP